MAKTAEQWFKEGEALTAVAKNQEALDCYSEALALKPDYVEALLAKGFALRLLGRFKEALECVNKAIKIDPSNAVAYSRKGMLQMNLGNHKDALKCLDKSISLDPAYAIAYNNKGIVLEDMEKFSEALDAFNKAIIIDSKCYLAHYNIGENLYRRKKYNEAVERMDKAFAIDPCALYQCIKGKSLNELGKSKEALEAFTIAYQLVESGKPGSGLSSANLNFIQTTLKSIAELQNIADKTQTKVKELDQDNPLVKRFVENLTSLQKQKEKITQQVFAKFNNGGASQSDKEEIEKIKQDYAQQLAQLEAAMQKQIDQIKGNVQRIDDQVAGLRDAFAEVKEELNNKMDDYNKKLDQKLSNQDLSSDDKIKIREYFKAFIGTFSSVHVTAQVIDSDQVVLNSDSSVATVLSMLASFSPFFGETLANSFTSMGEFLKSKELKTNARKMKRLASDSVELSQIVGKAAFEICVNLTKQQKIVQVTEDDLRKSTGNLFAKISKFCENMGEDVDALLYSRLYNSPASRVGHNDANKLIEMWVKGEITPYGISEEFVKQITYDNNDKGEKQSESVSTNEKGDSVKPSRDKKACCCNLF